MILNSPSLYFLKGNTSLRAEFQNKYIYIWNFILEKACSSFLVIVSRVGEARDEQASFFGMKFQEREKEMWT